MLTSIPSIRKKQIIAVTGVMLFGFLLAHLSGNFLIFKGPEALNAYAQFLHDLGPVLWGMRIGLIAAFVLHMFFTALVVVENVKARKARYAVTKDQGEHRTLLVRLMPYTGVTIFAYLIFHLLDFTFVEKTGFINGVDYGLYGLVVNTLSNPIHGGLYIIAMLAIGVHLAHAMQSVVQTFGFANKCIRPKLVQASMVIGFGIALAYCAIPIYLISCAGSGCLVK
ncbi:MAG: succinate dehydrogenase cytochrome b subunit [bacterium]|nr:succinate dehydrogenase cytochrome b subunit [bacterium]